MQYGPLNLRRIALQDANQIYALIDTNRLYLKKWLPWVKDCKTVKDTERFIERCIQSEEKKENLTVLMEYDQEAVGIISFRGFNWDQRETIIGYWLGENYQGKGIVTASCATILDYAFTELGFDLVRIRCELENRKSQAIPERLGFIKEKTIESEKIEYLNNILTWDMVYYCIDHEQWSKVNQTKFYKGNLMPDMYDFARNACGQKINKIRAGL